MKHIIPMRFSDENTNANQFIILYLNTNNEVVKSEYAYVILDNFTQNNYTKQAFENLSPEAFEFLSIPENLKGMIIKYNFDREKIAAKTISNGEAFEADLRFKQTPSNRAAEPDCDCYEWWIEIWSNHEMVSQHYESTVCPCDGGLGGGGSGSYVPGSSSGGGGSSNGSDPIAVNGIDNHLTDPCLISIINQIGSFDCENIIRNIFTDYYNSGDYVMLKIEQGAIVDQYGNPIAAKSFPVTTSNTFDWTITLNPDFVANSSREYLGNAFIHELLHCYAENCAWMNPGTPYGQIIEHTEMLTGWVNTISGAMHESFGISTYDAKAMAIASVGDILGKKIGNAVVWFPAIENMVFETYGIHLNQAQAIMDQYRNGTKGHKCSGQE